MVNILLCGCNGKMGKTIVNLAHDIENANISGGIDLQKDIFSPFPVVSSPYDFSGEVDVILDFSHPSVTDDLLSFALDKNLPIVIATTGLSEKQRESVRVASQKIPVFFSANMSLGINVMIDLIKKAAAVLHQDYDIEIVERHHNQKVDAPSGTALYLADEISNAVPFEPIYTFERHSRRIKREKNEIGIHAVRGGNIVGDHEVIFAGESEVIEIRHSASSKNVFAEGALRAAIFMQGKSAGLYDMSSIINA